MIDDVLINKIQSIERCLQRIREEYNGYEKDFKNNYTKQDSIILNLQRCCEIAIDIGAHIVRVNKLGVPQAGREVFDMLESNKIINKNLSERMQKMVGFRNIAVHDYKSIDIDILENVLKNHLDEFLDFNTSIQRFSNSKK
ncbi:DUF86 domain-containing protein [bacterium]